MFSRLQLGKIGEDLASNYLHGKGYDIIRTNFHCRHGEIDLVSEKEGEIIFVEVRTKLSSTEIPPEETVNYFKQKKLIRSAESYLFQKSLTNNPWRIDIIGIVLKKDGSLKTLEHLKGAVEE